MEEKENPQTIQDNNTQQPVTKKKSVRQKHAESVASILGDNTPREVTVAEPKKKKYGWVSTVLLIAIIAVGIYVMVKVAHDMGGDIRSLDEVILGANWKYALILLAALCVAFLLDSAKFYTITCAIEGKAKVRTSMKVHLLGKYYDNITPFATGGQPMQIYYLHKKGYSGGDSTAIVLIRYFAQMFSWLIVGCVLLATHAGMLMAAESITYSQRTLILTAGWIGLFVNMLVPLFILSFVIFPRFAYKLTSGVIGLGAKLHMVKDKEKTMGKALQVVKDFRMAFSTIIKKPVHLALLILFGLIECCITFALPFFVMGMLATGEVDLSISTMFAVMALNAYATFAVSVIPTPGNSGVAESISLIAFSVFLETVGVWVVFTWRFVVYYIYIIIGIGITIFEVIRKLVRAKRAKQKETSQGISEGNPLADSVGELSSENNSKDQR
jgi:hypothetical protein